MSQSGLVGWVGLDAGTSRLGKAEFKDGLLTLTMPKTEEVKPRHVKVQVA